jgi:hypothetical protein
MLGEASHRFPERRPHLLEDRRRRDRIAQVRGQETDDLPPDLQIRHIGIEVDPVQALQIQRHIPIENLIHRHRLGHAPQRDRSTPARLATHLGGPRRSLIR